MRYAYVIFQTLQVKIHDSFLAKLIMSDTYIIKYKCFIHQLKYFSLANSSMDYQTGEQLTRAKYTIQTMKNFISAKFTFIIMNCEKSMPEVQYMKCLENKLSSGSGLESYGTWF